MKQRDNVTYDETYKYHAFTLETCMILISSRCRRAFVRNISVCAKSQAAGE